MLFGICYHECNYFTIARTQSLENATETSEMLANGECRM